MIWLGSFWSRPPGRPPIVSIARWSPPWFRGPELRELAPVDAEGHEIGIPPDKRQWIECYKRILSERGRIRAVKSRIDAILAENSGAVMLACWCKVGRFRRDGSYSGSFCHRLLAGRLLCKLGYQVEVIDLECKPCRGPLSFDGGVVAGEFVCRRCHRASLGQVPQHSGRDR
jgi:hypothetical protein